MRTRRNRTLRRRTGRKMSRKFSGGKKKSGKKWTTAIDAAQKTLTKTGDIEAAKKSSGEMFYVVDNFIESLPQRLKELGANFFIKKSEYVDNSWHIS